MIANAQQVIASNGQKEIVVVRVRAVPGIGEPEILPDYDAEAVSRIVKGLIAGLSDPVANHVEVLIAVITHGRVVLACTIAQHRFRKAPVSAAGDEAATVDPDA